MIRRSMIKMLIIGLGKLALPVQLTIKALNMGISVKSKLWPVAPHILSRRLTEVRATLREIGHRDRDPKRRRKQQDEADKGI